MPTDIEIEAAQVASLSVLELSVLLIGMRLGVFDVAGCTTEMTAWFKPHGAELPVATVLLGLQSRGLCASPTGSNRTPERWCVTRFGQRMASDAIARVLALTIASEKGLAPTARVKGPGHGVH